LQVKHSNSDEEDDINNELDCYRDQLLESTFLMSLKGNSASIDNLNMSLPDGVASSGNGKASDLDNHHDHLHGCLQTVIPIPNKRYQVKKSPTERPANISLILKRMRENPPISTAPTKKKNKPSIRKTVWEKYLRRRQ